jgi:hypothetical protein
MGKHPPWRSSPAPPERRGPPGEGVLLHEGVLVDISRHDGVEGQAARGMTAEDMVAAAADDGKGKT